MRVNTTELPSDGFLNYVASKARRLPSHSEARSPHECLPPTKWLSRLLASWSSGVVQAPKSPAIRAVKSKATKSRFFESRRTKSCLSKYRTIAREKSSPMMSTVESPKRSMLATNSVVNSLGYDFAVLGLKANESRLAIIRKAACKAADRINEAATDLDEHDAMLSQLATSTYRLLDPRRRKRSHERVQLCVFSEDDLERQKSSRKPLVADANPKMVVAELVEASSGDTRI